MRPAMDRGVRLLRICLPAMFAGCGLAVAGNAHAALLPSRTLLVGDGRPGPSLGNGRFNRNSFIIDSPNYSHDVMHIRHVTVGGRTDTAALICKKAARRCVVIQRIDAFP
jgi:hypothetical protein